MNREVHVRFWEGLGVRFPWATQLGDNLCASALKTQDSASFHVPKLKRAWADDKDVVQILRRQGELLSVSLGSYE